ncbi:MAG: hypothetical protein AAB444_00285 [Patescibacteria group bacterium]
MEKRERCHIIVIDDNRDLAVMVQRILKQLQNVVITVFYLSPFGDQVLQYLKNLQEDNAKVDVLLTDIDLLGEIGFEIIHRIMLELPADCWPKFVVMSGDPEGNFGKNGSMLEYPDVMLHLAAKVEKPFLAETIEETIRSVIATPTQKS